MSILFCVRRVMVQQTVMQLFQKWIDCNQSLKVSVSGEKSRRSAWKPLVRNPVLLWVSVSSAVVDLGSTFIPFKLRLAIMSLSGLWGVVFICQPKVTRPLTKLCFIIGCYMRTQGKPASPGKAPDLKWKAKLGFDLPVWTLVQLLLILLASEGKQAECCLQALWRPEVLSCAWHSQFIHHWKIIKS